MKRLMRKIMMEIDLKDEDDVAEEDEDQGKPCSFQTGCVIRLIHSSERRNQERKIYG